MLHDHANLYVCGRNAMMYHALFMRLRTGRQAEVAATVHFASEALRASIGLEPTELEVLKSVRHGRSDGTRHSGIPSSPLPSGAERVGLAIDPSERLTPGTAVIRWPASEGGKVSAAQPIRVTPDSVADQLRELRAFDDAVPVPRSCWRKGRANSTTGRWPDCVSGRQSCRG